MRFIFLTNHVLSKKSTLDASITSFRLKTRILSYSCYVHIQIVRSRGLHEGEHIKNTNFQQKTCDPFMGLHMCVVCVCS